MRRRIDPVFLIFLVLMLFTSLRRYSSPAEWFIQTILIIPGVVIGLSFHEFAHGWVAWKLGDPTPKFQGRVTVNPKAHIDPIGFVALLFAGFGWGQPVEINPNNFKHRRRDELLVSLAGVVTVSYTHLDVYKRQDLVSPDRIMELALQITPDIKTIGALYNSSEVNSASVIDDLKAYAKKNGLKVEEAAVTNSSEIQ